MRLYSLLTIVELWLLPHSPVKPSFVAQSSSPIQQAVSTTTRTIANTPSDSNSCLQEQRLTGARLDVAHALNDCGVAAWERGDLADAGRYHRQALEIRQKLAPNSLEVAESLNRLSDAEEQLGYLAKAE